LGKDATWEREVASRIAGKRMNTAVKGGGVKHYTGRDAAEINALLKWLEKSPEKKKAMEEWQHRHGRKK
jgi:hypothetical protein